MITMKVSPQLDRWVVGFGRLADELAEEGLDDWREATEVFFDFTQEFVHVITGQLKGSGEIVMGRDGRSLVGEVVYNAPYALIEERKGGSHAYLTRGFAAASGGFAPAMAAGWEAVASSWS